MENNLIKLPDIDGNMRYHYFCPSCYYWIGGEDVVVNYCPHCGTQFFWKSEKVKDYHQMNYNYSIEYYERLKNGK